ncbi:MAG: AAA family ATPase, partial [Clostridia bacterium]|nr:AAA family ATPase [Clostridia bacterium]
MASKQKSIYICTNCGYESAKWYGKCPSCNEWGTLDEETIIKETKTTKKVSSGSLKTSNVLKLNEIDSSTEFRYNTGISELNRVLGGGLVKGSLVLLSGDPGIGKSTLLLQICNYLSKDLAVLYVSGEESAYQLKMRAKRLGVKSDNLSVMCETDAEIVC